MLIYDFIQSELYHDKMHNSQHTNLFKKTPTPLPVSTVSIKLVDTILSYTLIPPSCNQPMKDPISKIGLNDDHKEGGIIYPHQYPALSPLVTPPVCSNPALLVHSHHSDHQMMISNATKLMVAFIKV